MPCILQADLTLVDGQILRDVVVHSGRDGVIHSVERVPAGDSGIDFEALPPRRPIDESQPGEFGSPRSRRKKRLRGRLLVPGFVNAHSRSCLRLLRGRTEAHAGDGDGTAPASPSLLAEALTPDDVEAVAALAFAEMLRAGFTHVVEFQAPLPGQQEARRGDAAETSRRLLRAAEFAGIGITLVRTAIPQDGAGLASTRRAGQVGDRDPEALFRALADAVPQDGHGDRRIVQVAVGIRQPRRVDARWMRVIARHCEATGRVLHAVVAGEDAEVERCLAERGRRPIEWLADNGILSGRFTAIQADCLDEAEADLLGSAGCFACICPADACRAGTRAADIAALSRAGVRLSVGTGSHGRIDPFADLRTLLDVQRARDEMSQGGRLLDERALLDAGTAGGAGAAGIPAGRIAQGCRADLVALDLADPALAGMQDAAGGEEAVLASVIQGGHPRLVRDVWVGGRQVVSDGAMVRWEAAIEAFRRVYGRIWS